MARSRRNRRDNSFSHSIANDASLPFSSLLGSPFPSPPLVYDLRAISDRRTWHPEGVYRPASSFNRYQHTLTVRPVPRQQVVSRSSHYTPYVARSRALVRFENPDRVLVCVRRQRRREVLHALRKNGRRGQKPPRRSWYSSISCR